MIYCEARGLPCGQMVTEAWLDTCEHPEDQDLKDVGRRACRSDDARVRRPPT